MTKRKKITLIVISSFLAVILITACVIWCPRKLVNKLPDEKIISIVKEYERVTIDGSERAEVEIEQDKIAQFEEKINSLWYIKYFDFCKCRMSSPETYTITYEHYIVQIEEYWVSIYNTETKEALGPGRIYQIYPYNVYQQLKDLFLV